tara:strand:- start:139 stop:1155 length:1017 start_codon:yes stop_codon:yes gene_type:complete
MLYFYLIYSILIIISSFYIKKKKFLSNYTGDSHQLYSNKENIPLIGGIFLIIPILLTNYTNLIFFVVVISVSLIGIFSDKKILISPKKRFIFQIALIFFSVIFLNLEIISSKIVFFDNFLRIKTFNIIFTSFCLLILINGSNFIDGLNSLLLTYLTVVIFLLFKLNLIPAFIIKEEFINYLLIFLILLIFLNLCNILMLGDAGAYLLSFFVGYLIINCHMANPYISPYLFISIIWYPCYENLFSIIRKLKSKFSPLEPDNNHLHQLLYIFIKKKFFKKKLFANNISSILINCLNIGVIYISSIEPYSSIHQIKLIISSIFIYTIIFVYLKKQTKNYEQ